MTVGRFIAGVGGLIWHPASATYLFLRRAGSKDFAAGAWECVTGRVEHGEGFEAALHREIREETALAVTIEFIVGVTHFYRGEPVNENELLGVIYSCTLLDRRSVDIGTEHDAFVWLSVEEARARFSGDPHNNWLLKSLEWTEEVRALTSPELLAQFRARGFSIAV